jgi:hypothetical protein
LVAESITAKTAPQVDGASTSSREFGKNCVPSRPEGAARSRGPPAAFPQLPAGERRNISGRDGGQVWDGTNTRLRLGIAQCFEVLVDLPDYFDALSGRGDTGFTNVTPALKWQISPLPEKVDLSATMGVGLPTGTRAIVEQGAQPYVQFPWSWELSDGWA